jgi:hypothetical protein
VELVPKVPGGVLFFQRDSNKLLYSTLMGLDEPELTAAADARRRSPLSARVFCVGQVGR